MTKQSLLLCGLGFHQWNHLGYDIWEETVSGDFRIFCFTMHKKCSSCQKLVVSKSKDGIPPEVEIQNDSYIDKSVEPSVEKPLFVRG